MPASSLPGSTPRILGLVEGDPQRALSLVPQFLFQALRNRFAVSGLSYAPEGAAKLMLAAATFRPARGAWRARFHTSLRANRFLTRTLRSRVAALGEEFDVALQVHGWVGGQPRPYIPYIDQTRLMAERGWPDWLPLSPGERDEILELERTMYSGAAHIFAMGEPARRSVIDDYGIAPEHVTTVASGVNFEPLPEPSAPSTAPSILFIGREFERKGGDCLVEAFRLVRRERGDARLEIVGGPGRSEEPGIVSHGKVADRAQISELYRRSRVFCLPSRYEPWGLVHIEAMAHGLPCVGTDVQSIPHILGHGESGVVVPPDDPDSLAEALLRLLDDFELCAELGQAGRRRVEEEFRWGHVAERMTPAIRAAAEAK